MIISQQIRSHSRVIYALILDYVTRSNGDYCSRLLCVGLCTMSWRRIAVPRAKKFTNRILPNLNKSSDVQRSLCHFRLVTSHTDTRSLSLKKLQRHWCHHEACHFLKF